MYHTKQQLEHILKHEIEYLRKHTNHPVIHNDIDAVWVLSGPGTMYKPIDVDEAPWMSWMDKYRVMYGIALCKQITAKRLSKNIEGVTKDDVRRCGPLFIYNGTPKENNDFQQYLENERLILPKENVILLRVVHEIDGSIKTIENTLDQVKSIKEVFVKGNHRIRRLAIVSHTEHFLRILRYLDKYQTVPKETSIEIFSLSTLKDRQEEYLEEEMHKVWEYFKKGDLSWKAIPVLIDGRA